MTTEPQGHILQKGGPFSHCTLMSLETEFCVISGKDSFHSDNETVPLKGTVVIAK